MYLWDSDFKSWINGTFNKKEEEKNIIINILKKDFKMQNFSGKNWSAIFGQEVVKNILNLLGSNPRLPLMKNNLKPDIETNNFIYEVKTRCYSITGTAGEKILGVPYKYADVPDLYKKPLKIIVVGYQEYEAEYKFKLFNPTSINQQDLITFWKKKNITFLKTSYLYLRLILKYKLLIMRIPYLQGYNSILKKIIELL